MVCIFKMRKVYLIEWNQFSVHELLVDKFTGAVTNVTIHFYRVLPFVRIAIFDFQPLPIIVERASKAR